MVVLSERAQMGVAWYLASYLVASCCLAEASYCLTEVSCLMVTSCLKAACCPAAASCYLVVASCRTMGSCLLAVVFSPVSASGQVVAFS